MSNAEYVCHVLGEMSGKINSTLYINDTETGCKLPLGTITAVEYREGNFLLELEGRERVTFHPLLDFGI